jgi:ubiquinone/menaquinone biosynthesis C-methylase UbiE
MTEEAVLDKRRAELSFWCDWLERHGMGARSDYYRQFMMDMGDVRDDGLFTGKVCLDIGCGPMGSLTWLDKAKAAIGLDPLVEDYLQFGISEHAMLYLKGRAEDIPLPSRYVDVVFSMNSLDHVDNLAASCREIQRVLRPGGYFIGSLNLNVPPTPAEPWTMTEDLLAQILFRGWERIFYRVRPKVEDGGDPYRYFRERCPPELASAAGPQVLWCRFRVPLEAGGGATRGSHPT